MAVAKSINFRERYFQSYQTTYIEKDVRDLARSLDIVQFALVAQSFLIQSGNLVNIASMANDLKIDQRTLKRYAELMEATFQITFLQPWSGNAFKRVIKTPKVYAKDSGFSVFAHRIHSPEDLPQSHDFGELLETFLFAELRKKTQLIPGLSLYFYRTDRGKEVDFVLEYGQKLIGIELKAASSVGNKDFAGLVDLEEANSGHLDLGLVLYQGDEIVHFSHNKIALPLKYFLFF